ncbi:MAG: alpha-amylase family glycosyl hydrolase [Bacteroidetes bacterium]|nr:alpha-amylase family glycosyl hydrolase [Bacteroidota bacterium]
MKYYLTILALVATLWFTACTNEPTYTQEAASWHENATIYEVNVRQYTQEGTFDAFGEHVPTLAEMGVEILWFMPIHPIGEKNRKGPLGSYYSVKDYKGVNSEFGTKEDFKELVDLIHANDMKVILDWVPNHTAWDHPWTETNPEYYTLTEDGDFMPPVPDWSDVIDLNFDNAEMREEMIQAMEYWVSEFDVDGYRVDVAHSVPTDFHEEVRERLDKIKPVFMLAEAEVVEHHYKAFDMSYAWNFNSVIYHVGQGDSTVSAIHRAMEKEIATFPRDAYRMFFTTNHDENSWKGSDVELYGDNVEVFSVLASTIYGMPLVYSGQESLYENRLEFFDRDQIDWKDYPLQDFFTMLLTLNQENTALWNGEKGGPYEYIDHNDDTGYFAYRRANDADKVVVFLNFGDEPLNNVNHTFDGEFVNVTTQESVTGESTMTLPANGWAIYSRS